MTEHLAGGNRRIDRVLAQDYLDGITALALTEVRLLRGEAEQEEADLSYLRRLVQGRLDLIHAEQARRAGSGGSLIEALPQILADAPRAPARGLGRHHAAEPSRTDSHRRHVEALVADVGASDVGELTDAELAELVETFSSEEQQVSRQRRAVQAVADACSGEITRRYRDGEADVGQLLSES